MSMTPQQRLSVAYAPELAVIHALQAVADAATAALAAAHPLEIDPPHSPEHLVATRLYAVIQQLSMAADAYWQSVSELQNRGSCDDEAAPF
jgi:hypothetical protein